MGTSLKTDRSELVDRSIIFVENLKLNDSLESSSFMKMLLSALGFDTNSEAFQQNEYVLNIAAKLDTGQQVNLLGGGLRVAFNNGNTTAQSAQIVNADGIPVEAVGSGGVFKAKIGDFINMGNGVPAGEMQVAGAVAAVSDKQGNLVVENFRMPAPSGPDAHFYTGEIRAEDLISKLKASLSAASGNSGKVSTAADDGEEEYTLTVLTERTTNGAKGLTEISVPVRVTDNNAAPGGPHSGCDTGVLGLAAMGLAFGALALRPRRR